VRRADRLFQIIQILRRRRTPVTADALAAELETSKRTVYRDVADLVAQRVPIRGEAGLGYVLDRGYDMPPLMLTPDEIEVAVLGAEWVSHRGDAALRRAAQDLIAKIAATVPERLRPLVLDPGIGAPPAWEVVPDTLDMASVREAVRAGTKIRIHYRDEKEHESERVVWPVVVGYFDATRVIVAFCELRQDFRKFRTDRVVSASFLKEKFGERPSALRARWRKTLPPQR
jgi:predicted DNA-binding transcriptional regulator YafY